MMYDLKDYKVDRKAEAIELIKLGLGAGAIAVGTYVCTVLMFTMTPYTGG